MPQRLRDYGSVEEVAERLRRNNPRLTPERAAWLAPHWARQDGERTLGDPGRPGPQAQPVLYRAEEVMACWAASPLRCCGSKADRPMWRSTGATGIPRAEFEARLSSCAQFERVVLDDAGHMLHHDQPRALAGRIEAFLR